MKIDQELKDVIAKNLPQAVGEALQERLKQADYDAALVKDLEGRLDKLRQSSAELAERNKAQAELIAKHRAIDEREAAVESRERDAEVNALRVQLAAANGNAQFARDVALGLVRNTEYRRTVLGGQTINEPILPPGATYPTGTMTTNKTDNTTDTSEAK